MCEQCEKYAAVEKEMAIHFNKEMNEYAKSRDIDLISIRNVLGILFQSADDQLTYSMVKEKIEGIKSSSSHPSNTEPKELPNFTDADFNKLISEI